jgi:hypothetical protein
MAKFSSNLNQMLLVKFSCINNLINSAGSDCNRE